MAQQSGQGTSGKAPNWWRRFHDKFVVEERFMEPESRKALYRWAVILIGVGSARQQIVIRIAFGVYSVGINVTAI